MKQATWAGPSGPALQAQVGAPLLAGRIQRLAVGGSYAPLISGAREAPPKRVHLGPAQLIWV
jgi:hypothetical protein